MDLPTALARCRVARAAKDYHHLATFAHVAITAEPHNLEAWCNLAIAFYALRRYDNSAQATLAALAVSTSPDTSSNLRLLFRTSRLLSRLCNVTNPSPTTRLTSGWYKARLLHLIDYGLLRPFPTAAQIATQPERASASITDCAIVHRPSSYVDWEVVYNRDGGERNFPPSLLDGFPLDQTSGGYLYLKERSFSFGCECYDEGCGPCDECREQDFPTPVYHFPKFPLALPQQVTVLGGPLLSVHVATGLIPNNIHQLLCEQLTKLGMDRPDSPVPKYHNIIDPNIAALDGVWVPTEFDVEEVSVADALHPVERAMRRQSAGPQVPSETLDHIHHLSGNTSYGRCSFRSGIPDLEPHKYSTLYVAIEHVLNAALPLLANLQLPALLLPGPLQAVVKAQRIVLNDGDSYEGIWHDDGLREPVVAIVLYYYGVSPCLSGGGMELASKRRMRLWCGDNDGKYRYGVEGVRSAIEDLPRCVVPVQEGTMLVFNNYAAVHRVLPMTATGSSGSREFLAFFIIDQKAPLPVPENLGPRDKRMLRRSEMLREQLQVRGHFGVDGSEVISTGNGCVSDLAWITSGESYPLTSYMYVENKCDEDGTLAIASRLNMTPPVIGRGWSFLTSLDMPEVQFSAGSSYILHMIDGHEWHERFQIYVNTSKRCYTSVLPEDGIRALQLFDNAEQWLELGFWTDDWRLRERISAGAEGCSGNG